MLLLKICKNPLHHTRFLHTISVPGTVTKGSSGCLVPAEAAQALLFHITLASTETEEQKKNLEDPIYSSFLSSKHNPRSLLISTAE